MTLPLMVLAVGAIVAGFVSIPPALGGGAALEHFLEPSLTAPESATSAAEGTAAQAAEPVREAAAAEAAHEEPHISHGAELGLMAFSVMIALIGIYTALRFYVVSPSTADGLKERAAASTRCSTTTYFVDESALDVRRRHDEERVWPVGLRPACRRWRRQRLRVVDGVHVVGVEPHRSVRGRWRRESRRAFLREDSFVFAASRQGSFRITRC
jgi:NADH:ubiquinone oxidoreductase subunit 5 (subunit L)/multisubunit Na+/H+ antiporter MnhA subunit